MGISGIVTCDCRFGGGAGDGGTEGGDRGGGGHVAGPEGGKSVYLWSCEEVDVFYIVEIGIDILSVFVILSVFKFS